MNTTIEKHDFYICFDHNLCPPTETVSAESLNRIRKSCAAMGHRFGIDLTVVNSSGERVLWRVPSARDDNLHAVINERARTVEAIKDHAVNGILFYQTGGTDCDMCQGHSGVLSMPANYVSWAKMVEQEHAWAEGPVWQRMLYIDELDDVKPGSRDLALEAFEDGHPHVVSEVRFDEYSEERI